MTKDPSQAQERRWFTDNGERAFDCLAKTEEGIKSYWLRDGELIEIKAIAQADGSGD